MQSSEQKRGCKNVILHIDSKLRLTTFMQITCLQMLCFDVCCILYQLQQKMQIHEGFVSER